MEIWKDIPTFEGVYQVSNLGNVKSLSRIILKKGKFFYKSKEKILSKTFNGGGYFIVNLQINNKRTVIQVHQLVAMAFLGHKRCRYKFVINHKNFIRTDNRVENLEIVTQRENSNRRHLKSTSKYVGVSRRSDDRKWTSNIVIDGRQLYLGSYETELEASHAYQSKLIEVVFEVVNPNDEDKV